MQKEAPFSCADLFFSVTELKGVIEFGNDTFFRIAEFDREELVGQPHNVIRHPWMPRAVFKLLWDYLHQGKEIAAYVVNRTQSGRYYWVFGVFSPVLDDATGTTRHYLSVRLKPTSERLAVVQDLYHQMREIEAESGMDGSTAHLLESLQGLGFADYSTFMHDSLRIEKARYMEQNILRDLAARYRPRGRSDLHSCQHALQKGVASLVEGVRALSNAGKVLQDLQSLLQQTHEFFALTKDSSMNVAIASGKLEGTAARMLAPVVFELLSIAANGEQSLRDFSNTVGELLKLQEHVLFHANKTTLYGACLLQDIDSEIAHATESSVSRAHGVSEYAGLFAQVTLHDLLQLDREIRAYINNAQGLFDLIGRKLGYAMILGRTLSAQGIVQAEGCGAASLLNTLSELQKEIFAFESQLDHTAEGFRDITGALHTVELSVVKSTDAYEQIEDLLGGA